MEGELPILWRCGGVCMSPTARGYARRRTGNLDIGATARTESAIEVSRAPSSLEILPTHSLYATDFGRLYTTNISPVDEEFWLSRTHRIMRVKLRKLSSNPDGNVVLLINISESTIRWHPLPICADYWDQSDEEEPWAVFCGRVEEVVRVGEFPMLILVPMKDYSRPLKFMTSIKRIQERRCFEEL